MSALSMAPLGRSRSDPRSDPDLIAAVGNGDSSALGELYDRHHECVWRVLYRATNRSSDVDDIVQATFLTIPRIATAYDGRGSCRAWLCGIALGLASRQRRSLGRLLRGIASFGVATAGDTGIDPEREAGAREELRRFERALHRLAPKKREAFLLVELEGMNINEAAAALGVPSATIRTRLFHARRELRQCLYRGEPR